MRKLRDSFYSSKHFWWGIPPKGNFLGEALPPGPPRVYAPVYIFIDNE